MAHRLTVLLYDVRLRSGQGEIQRWLAVPEPKREGDIVEIEDVEPPIWRVEGVVPELRDNFEGTLICTPAEGGSG
jgi:hypothetical protein